jgi:hypothetical protein
VIGSGRKAVIVMARGRFGCSFVAHILPANLQAKFAENWDA